MFSWKTVLESAVATPLARRALDARFRAAARRRLSELDNEPSDRAQLHTLLRLVHRAQGTRFGRDHDLRRIRTLADFRRLVPLRTVAELVKEYGSLPEPGATWPGPVCSRLPSSTICAGEPCLLPVTPALVAVQRSALLTALAFAVSVRPRTHLFSGRIAVIQDATPTTQANEGRDCFESMVLRDFPVWWRPFVTLAECGGGIKSAEATLKETSASRLGVRGETPITAAIGSGPALLRTLRTLRQANPTKRLTETYPNLAAVLYRSEGGPQLRPALRELIADEQVLLLELDFRPEAAIALEDPREGLLRLLPDRGAFFEFVPQEEAHLSNARRDSLSEVEIGIPYRLAVSSVAGVWACLLDGVYVFDQRQPPLLHRLPKSSDVPARSNPPHPFPVQAPHARSDIGPTLSAPLRVKQR